MGTNNLSTSDFFVLSNALPSTVAEEIAPIIADVLATSEFYGYQYLIDHGITQRTITDDEGNVIETCKIGQEPTAVGVEGTLLSEAYQEMQETNPKGRQKTYRQH